MKASNIVLAVAATIVCSAAHAQFVQVQPQVTSCAQAMAQAGTGAATRSTTCIAVLNDTAYPITGVQTVSTRYENIFNTANSTVDQYARQLVPANAVIPPVGPGHIIGGRVILDFSQRGTFYCEAPVDRYSNMYLVQITFLGPNGPLVKRVPTVVDICRTQFIRASAYLQ